METIWEKDGLLIKPENDKDEAILVSLFSLLASYTHWEDEIKKSMASK